MIVFKHFCEKIYLFSGAVNELAKKQVRILICSLHVICNIKASFQGASSVLDNITRSLVLAVSVCYHARLQDREEYEEGVTEQFGCSLLPDGVDQFRNEIRW